MDLILIRQSLALALVFVLLWWAVSWLRKRGYATVGSRLRYSEHPRELDLIERLALTPQHSLHLIRVKQRVILVGLHPAGFTLLVDSAVATEGAPAGREVLTK